MKKYIIGAALVLSAALLPQQANAQSVIQNIINFFTGSSASAVTVNLSASSPLKSLVQISKTAPTENVVLAKYDIKSGQAGTLRMLRVGVGSTNTRIAALFKNIKLNVNGQTYSVDNISSDAYIGTPATATFTNLNVPLLADQSITLTILGSVAADTTGALSGASASTSLPAYYSNSATVNPWVEDANGRVLNVAASQPVSSEITFSSSQVVISGTSAVLGDPVVVQNKTLRQSAAFSFTVTAGDNTVYISSDPAKALLAQSTGLNVTPSFPIGAVLASPATISGDSNVSTANGYYVVPAGSSRTFTYNTLLVNDGGLAGLKTMWISAIKYGQTSSVLMGNSITYGLGALKVSTTLDGSSYPLGATVFTSNTSAATQTTFASEEGVWVSYYTPASFTVTAVNLTFDCPTGITSEVCGTTVAGSTVKGSIGIYKFKNVSNADQKVTLRLKVNTTAGNVPLTPTSDIVIKKADTSTGTGPSISSVTSPIQDGGEMNVKGTQLITDSNKDGVVNSIDLALMSNNGWITIDGIAQKTLQFTGYHENGDYLSFKIPQLAPGQHTIVVKNESGVSSPVQFQISADTSTGVVVSINASSPLQSLVQISRSAQTNSVLLAKYDIKSPIDATLRGLNVAIPTTVPKYGLTSAGVLLSEAKISINGHTYSPELFRGFTAIYTNLNEALPANQTVTVSVYGDVKADTENIFTGSTAFTSITAVGVVGGTSNNPSVEDSSFRTIAVKSATVSSSLLSFSLSNVVVSGLSGTLGSAIVRNNITIAQNASFIFTLTAGNNTIYLSADPKIALNTTISGIGVDNTTGISDVTANPSTISGDVSGKYFVIPAGSSRTFSYSGTIDLTKTTSFQVGLQISAIQYGTNSSSLTSNRIDYGLAPLKVVASGGDGNGTGSNGTVMITANPATLAGDSTSSFVIPAGASRMFTVANTTASSFSVPKISSANVAEQANPNALAGDSATAYVVPAGTTRTFIITADTDSISVTKYYLSLVQNGTVTTVKVLSPNGGEVLNILKSNTISWSGGKDRVMVGIVDSKFDAGGVPIGWIALNAKPNSSTVWNGYTVVDLSGTKVSELKDLSSGPYKIIAVSANASNTYCFRSPTTTCNVDLSDGYFRVGANAIPSITSIQPSSAAAGTKVTIYGSNLFFAGSVAKTGVTFNNATTDSGTTPTSIAYNGQSLSFIVPNLTPANYTITIEGVGIEGRSNSLPFTVTPKLPNPTTTVTPPPPSGSITLSAELTTGTEDQAGSWGVFNPGKGNVNQNSADWNWNAKITLPTSKTIKRMTLISNNKSEVWSTGYSRYLADGTDLYGYNEHPYPLVVFENGCPNETARTCFSKNNYAYDYTFASGPGTHPYHLYGQREGTSFSGGTLIVEFSDGTSVKVPVSVGPQPAVSNPPTVSCPVNYTCTPKVPGQPYPSQIPACPSGYTCAPTPQVSTTPLGIFVTNPQSGQTYTDGQKMTITWKTSGYSSTQKMEIFLSLDANPGNIGLPIAKVANTGSYTWTVKSVEPFFDSEAGRTIYPNGSYWISVACVYGDSTCPDNANRKVGNSGIFKIVSAPTVSCPAGHICVPAGSAPSCPTGYTCSLVDITSCPTGYVCYSKTSATTPSPSATVSPSYSPSYSPMPTYSTTPTPTYSSTPTPTYSSTPTPSTYYSPTPTTSATPTYSSTPTTSSSPKPTTSTYYYPTSSATPSGSTSSFNTSNRNFVSSVFYAVGDLLDQVF